MDSLNVFSPSVIGADVHKKSIVCCARYLNGTDWKKDTATFSTTKSELLKMGEWCKQFSPNFILMESTGVYWMSPFNYLERAGLRVYIVNPRSVKGMIGKKTDTSDAEWLATKGNDGSFKPSYIPDDEWRKLRDVERNLITLTQEMTRLKNREVKMFLTMGYRLDSVFSDPFGVNAQRAKEAILAGKTPEQVLLSIDTRYLKSPVEDLLEAFNGDLDEEHVRVILSNRKVMDVIKQEISENRHFIISEVQKREPQLYDLFQTLPGIDEYHSASLVIEFGGNKFVSAFSNEEKFASWLGISPGNKESGGKRFPCRSGHGNWAARRCLCEAAHAASHVKDSTIQSRYRSQRARIGTKKAVISCAHYLARLAYVVASRMKPYQDPCIDYEAISFDKTFKRYVKKALQYKEKWALDVENLETGETYQSSVPTANARANANNMPGQTPRSNQTSQTRHTPATESVAHTETTPVSEPAPVEESITSTVVEQSTKPTTESASNAETTPVAEPALVEESVTSTVVEQSTTPVTESVANTDAVHESDPTNVAETSSSTSTVRTEYEQCFLLFIFLIIVMPLVFAVPVKAQNSCDVQQQDNVTAKKEFANPSHIEAIATVSDMTKDKESYLIVPIQTILSTTEVRGTHHIRGSPKLID